jgi:hypothetical protein
MFFLSSLEAAKNFFGLVIYVVPALNNGYIGAVPDILRVEQVSMAFAERQVINRIEQVGFTHAIVSQKAINLGRQTQIGLLNVFIIQYG